METLWSERGYFVLLGTDHILVYYPVISYQRIMFYDLVHPKMSPTLSFSGMYRKLFIYRMNKTNS